MSVKKQGLGKVYWLSWVVYTCAYLGRYNFSAAVAGIVSDGLFTKSEMGLVGTVFFFVYGSGQLINGFLGDRFSPFKMIFIGSFVSAIANFGMSFVTTLPAMVVVWGINGFAQSMLWSPIIYLVSNTFTGDKLEKAQANLPATLPIGSLMAYLFSMVLMKYSSWKFIFIAASIMLFVASLIWGSYSLSIGKEGRKISSAKQATDSAEKAPLSKILIASGVLLMFVPVMLHSMLKDGVMTWVPTMVSELFAVSPSFSVMLSLVLPVVNFFGARIASSMHSSGKFSEMKITSLFFAFTALPLIGLVFITYLNAVVSVVLLALITSSMVAINYVFLTLVPVSFASHGRSATMAGLLDAVAYAGSAVSSYGFGAIADNIGWNKTIIIWLAIVCVAMAFCAITVRRWERFKKFN
ncbi:MAG: MFS transporter [Clostridia bacterium]|nr:MFS transporter [Clostridia bacterium]